MTTENTSQLPPCPLPDCEGGEHHYHDIDAYAIGEKHDCAKEASLGYRCYGPHRPGLSEPINLPEVTRWQPIKLAQIKAGMRIRTTTAYPDRITTHTGVAHHADADSYWRTEDDTLLTGWPDPTTYEVDPATIPDPDAELIEAVGKAIHDADKRADDWDEDPSAETYRKLARAALTALRTHVEAGERR